MIKLTRLNHHVVAINPDHISWVDATPDTTLCLIGGEKILVRETLSELIALVVAFRRQVHATGDCESIGPRDGDPPRVTPPLSHLSQRDGAPSSAREARELRHESVLEGAESIAHSTREGARG